jgi:bifunctional oligoribonuclease and PAP phosphatase NrnA
LTVSSEPSRTKRNRILREIAETVRRGRKFLVASHENPEGDAIGSILALGRGLRRLGKQVTLFNPDPVPEVLAFLPGAKRIVRRLPAGARFDAAFALDCGDRKRLGDGFPGPEKIGRLVNIDHHASNTRFGDLNLVDPLASSAAEMVFDVLRALSAPPDRPAAENIYAGILTDTGSFRYANTREKTFSAARACVLLGVEPWKIADKIYDTQPPARLILLRRVLKTLKIEAGGKVSSVVVTRRMLLQAGAVPALTEDFINFPRSVKGTQVAILFREAEAGKYRVSFRSRGRVDVSRISRRFGGGGHPNAAGCTVAGTLREVRAKVLRQVRGAF